MILESQVIFLDTSIFFSENFIEGTKLNQLTKTASKEGLKIKIVDITYNECLKRIESSISKTKTIFKQVNASLNGDGRILRNLPEYQVYYKIPKRFTLVDENDKMIKIFDDFLHSNKIEVIDSSFANHKDVFDKYFKKEPPFGTGQKKDEFPDAFVLDCIEKYCLKYKTTCFLVSTDNDMLSYQSKIIHFREGLPAMLDTFVRASEVYKELYNFMKDKISYCSEEIQEKLIGNEDDLSVLLYESLIYDPHYEELEYEPGEILMVEMDSHYIMSLNEEETEAEIEFDLCIRIPLFYNDLSMAHYDKEDGRYWNVTNIAENSVYKLKVSSRALFEYLFKGDLPIDFEDIQLSEFQLLSWEKLEENIEEKSEYTDW